MVPLSSYGIPRVPHYSGFSLPFRRFTYKTVTFYGLSSHTVQLQLRVDYAVQNPGNITTPGLASFAFARRYWRNLGWFLFLALLRCFSSGGSLRITMYSLYGQYPCRYWGFPIRKSTDRNLFAVPRGLSQPITSFFGSQWQGIHPVLFLAWPFVQFRILSGNTAKKRFNRFSFQRCGTTFRPILIFFAIVVFFARRTKVRLSLENNDSLLKNLAEDKTESDKHRFDLMSKL